MKTQLLVCKRTMFAGLLAALLALTACGAPSKPTPQSAAPLMAPTTALEGTNGKPVAETEAGALFVSAGPDAILVDIEGRAPMKVGVNCAARKCGMASIAAELDTAVVVWSEHDQGALSVWAARIHVSTWVTEPPFLVSAVGHSPSVVVWSGRALIGYSAAFGGEVAAVDFDAAGTPTIHVMPIDQWDVCSTGSALVSLTALSTGVLAAVATAKRPESSCPQPCTDCVQLKLTLHDVGLLGGGPTAFQGTLLLQKADSAVTYAFALDSLSAASGVTDGAVDELVAVAISADSQVRYFTFDPQTGQHSLLRSDPTGANGGLVSVAVDNDLEIAALVTDNDPNFGTGSVFLVQGSIADFPAANQDNVGSGVYHPHIFVPTFSPSGCVVSAVWDTNWARDGLQTVQFRHLSGSSVCA